MIDIVNEQIECANPLLEPALDAVPFGRRNQPRDRVEGNDPLDPLIAAVHRERDPLLAHRQVGDLVAPLQFLGAQFDQSLMQRRVVRPRALTRVEHLVVGRQADSGGTGRSRRAVFSHASWVQSGSWARFLIKGSGWGRSYGDEGKLSKRGLMPGREGSLPANPALGW